MTLEEHQKRKGLRRIDGGLMPPRYRPSDLQYAGLWPTYFYSHQRSHGLLQHG